VVELDRLLGNLAQRHDRVLVVVAIEAQRGARGDLARSAGRRAAPSSNRFGILTTQSSTVTRAILGSFALPESTQYMGQNAGRATAAPPQPRDWRRFPERHATAA
jgi:hypothetical protein